MLCIYVRYPFNYRFQHRFIPCSIYLSLIYFWHVVGSLQLCCGGCVATTQWRRLTPVFIWKLSQRCVPQGRTISYFKKFCASLIYTIKQRHPYQLFWILILDFPHCLLLFDGELCNPCFRSY